MLHVLLEFFSLFVNRHEKTAAGIVRKSSVSSLGLSIKYFRAIGKHKNSAAAYNIAETGLCLKT